MINPAMITLLQDLRYAARTFLRNPGFTVAAALSLVIGIGANTAIFSVTSALLLHPLPYRDAERLVILWNRSPGLGITEDWFSTAQYFDIKNGHHGLEDVAIAFGAVENLTGDGEPERIGTIHVSSNLLPMLGAHAERGRLFTAEEDLVGAPGTAIINYGTWMRRYGGSPAAIGKPLTISGKPYQIVGVLPKSFSLPREVMPTLYGAEDAEVLLPFPLSAGAATIRDHEDYNIIGKLKPGVSLQQAQTEMATITARLRRDFPEAYPPNGGLTFGIVPLLDQVVGDIRRRLIILACFVACVLLIACANVANLLLSRALARQKEIAVRAALGASRVRLARQLLTESVLLAVGGGLLGMLLAAAGIKLIHVWGSKSIPRLQEIAINLEVLLFTFVLSVFAGILFGMAPVLRLYLRNLQAHLQEAARGSSGASGFGSPGNNLRNLLVVFELALSVGLLIAAGLLTRSFVRLQGVSPGFNPQNVLTLELTISGPRYSDKPAIVQTYRQLRDRLERLPGVSAAGAVSSLPLSQMFAWGPITVEGRTPQPGEKFINADVRVAAGDYFQAMQIPLISGRLFNDQDTADSPPVIVVDEYMARQLWPGQDATGKRIHNGSINDKTAWMTVVGVVGRIKQDTLDSDSRIAYYAPHAQYPVRAMNVVLRSRSDPSLLTSAVKREIHELDPGLPLYNVVTMARRVSDSLARQRFTMLLLGLFAVLALGLATVGTYGVMSYLVGQSTREIGIRMALGATPRGILTLVLRRGMTVSLAGVGLGVLVALSLTRFIRSFLFGIKASDPPTYIAIGLLLISAALLASYVPARRAARIDPMESLRCE
jgi:predicted permease